MFGGGFGGYGNSKLRMVRIGLLLVVIAAGLALHGSGHTYTVIRTVYLVVILGLLAYSFSRRRQRGGYPNQGPRGRWGGSTWGGGASGPGDVRPSADRDAMPALQPPGWFPDPTTPGVERYWDGSNWVKSRHHVGNDWVED